MKGWTNWVIEMNQTFLFVVSQSCAVEKYVSWMNGFEPDHSGLIGWLTDGDEDDLVKE
jgi:hypothetical protein